MRFYGMNFRAKAIKLYKQGKDIKTIDRQIGIRLDKKMIEKWVEEERQFEEKSNLIKQSIKIKKQLKRRENLSEEKIKDLNQQHLEILTKLLELDSENSVAKLDYFRTLYNLRMFEEAKKVGEEILEDNVPVLNSLANISCQEKDYERAILYMNRIIELQPNNEKYRIKLKKIEKTAEMSKKPEYKNRVHTR